MRPLALCVLLTACGGGAAATQQPTAAPLPTTTADAPPPTATTQTDPTPPPPTTGIHFSGGDGSSVEKAIVILGAKGERDGVAAEYSYVEKHLGLSRNDVVSQSLLDKNGRSFDMLQLKTAQGSRQLYFDITDYFGKF